MSLGIYLDFTGDLLIGDIFNNLYLSVNFFNSIFINYIYLTNNNIVNILNKSYIFKKI
jgi:hypothetical protein